MTHCGSNNAAIPILPQLCTTTPGFSFFRCPRTQAWDCRSVTSERVHTLLEQHSPGAPGAEHSPPRSTSREFESRGIQGWVRAPQHTSILRKRGTLYQNRPATKRRWSLLPPSWKTALLATAVRESPCQDRSPGSDLRCPEQGAAVAAAVHVRHAPLEQVHAGQVRGHLQNFGRPSSYEFRKV